MAEGNDPRIQQMVPDPDRMIEHGQKPTNYVRPPKPPTQVPNGGVGNATKD
ncbi:hypothetical protein SAMN05428970_2959 [Agromyces sp. CF514]|nr:hypothetical protein SAMN05428970_2959 [Agromyces sp. CF514]